MKFVNIFTFHNTTYYTYYIPYKFYIHRVVHRNIISIVKPKRCTNVSNLFYFRMTLYIFRTVFPFIMRSSTLYIQQQACYVCQTDTAVCLLASRQLCLFDKCLLL